MQALGTDIGKPAHRTAAQAVVRETLNRAQKNVLRLFEELLALGYRFQNTVEPTEPDYPLELRLEHALEFVRNRGGIKYKANPWSHPALAWVEEEEIELPARFRNGRPGRANHRPPGARLEAALDEMEQQSGRPLPLAVRGWFKTVGSVDLTGTHPLLNPAATVAALRITPAETNAETAPGVGAEFVATIRHAFEWGGFPGWSGRDNPPQRELAWLRSRLLPL